MQLGVGKRARVHGEVHGPTVHAGSKLIFLNNPSLYNIFGLSCLTHELCGFGPRLGL